MKYFLIFITELLLITVNSIAQEFRTIEIKKTQWMVENLNVSRFRNGDIILQAVSKSEWDKAITNKKPAWCFYENKSKNKLGKIYNWYAINDPRGLAPLGYRIPSMQEWRDMINFLGEHEKTRVGSFKKVEFSNTRAAIKLLKEGDTIPIITNYQGESGFNGSEGGCRNCGWENEDINGFSKSDKKIGWWTSTDQNWDTDKKYFDGHEYELRSKIHTDSAYVFILNKNSLSILRTRFPKSAGFFVRCVRDIETSSPKKNTLKSNIESKQSKSYVKSEEKKFCFSDKFNSGNFFELVLLDGGKAKITIKDPAGLVIRTGQGTWQGFNDGQGGEAPKIILNLTTGKIIFTAIVDTISSSINMLIDSKQNQWINCW
jgi:uncharacterized protein (TIGR02145 family)